MDRDIAIRIDALLVNAVGNIDALAAFLKNNVSEEEFNRYVPKLGECMYHLIEFSEDLRKTYPDIITPNLKRDL